MAVRDPEDVSGYLATLLSFYRTYHDHKETMAWAGLALYTIVAVQLPRAMSFIQSDSLYLKSIVTILFAIVSVVMFLYIRIQFKLRKRSADYMAAIQSYYSNRNWLLNIENSDQSQFEVQRRSKRTDGLVHHKLPKYLIDAADETARFPDTTLKNLERCCYSLLWIITFIILAVMGKDIFLEITNRINCGFTT